MLDAVRQIGWDECGKAAVVHIEWLLPASSLSDLQCLATNPVLRLPEGGSGP